MNMKKYLLMFTFFILFSGIKMYAGNFNFPHNVAYPYGIQATTPDNNKIQSLYSTWLQFYEEGPNGLARIKYDTPDHTVSEGIAYGMLIFVYMENGTNNTQPKFDKLYAYYKHFGRFNGYLMEWKINGFSSVNLDGSATDADVDVALALLMAHKQWGSAGNVNYIAEAEALLAEIYNRQVNSQNLIKPGDHWMTKKILVILLQHLLNCTNWLNL
jgi:endoglucanase